MAIYTTTTTSNLWSCLIILNHNVLSLSFVQIMKGWLSKTLPGMECLCLMFQPISSVVSLYNIITEKKCSDWWSSREIYTGNLLLKEIKRQVISDREQENNTVNSTVVLVTEDVFGQCMQVASDTTRKSSTSHSMAMQWLHAHSKLIWASTWQKGACVIFI